MKHAFVIYIESADNPNVDAVTTSRVEWAIEYAFPAADSVEVSRVRFPTPEDFDVARTLLDDALRRIHRGDIFL
jgi:hypothetical protein